MTFEVEIDGVWRSMPAVEAHYAHRDASKRCPDCYGAMLTVGTYTGERKATLQHRKTHDGCPRAPRHYTGTPARHPAALT
ncbi:hypothetical protein [Methylobacterium sp. WL9]|uniref:hypothetical protein n=1 Tax=Methylobacterium sp. WL9 TaxID=2603898 RepID=UPI0011D541CA|nr:hypothetical protein [Methylobacterium sp. WL9]TXN21285.1 hypothetical protein FV217_14920 [Methylobacterium sp. WL9]